MNTKRHQPTRINAFSAVDLIVVIGTLVLVVTVVLPMLARPKGGRSTRIQCISNLKQVSLGVRLAMSDGEPLPDFKGTNQAWNYIEHIGKEIGSPKVLICPEDKVRSKGALDFETNKNSFASPDFQNAALSYFFNPDVLDAEPSAVLTGDRTLSTSSNVLSGLLVVSTNVPLQWANGLHKDGGNIALMDGSVHQLTTSKLRQTMQVAYSTNGQWRFLMP